MLHSNGRAVTTSPDLFAGSRAGRLTIVGALFCTVSAPALAADPASTAAAEPVTVAAPETEAPAAGDSVETPHLNEIVVTATKRVTNLQKTPIAISVVDGAMLADRHVQSLINLADGAVPSLRVATFEARQSALTIGIRGIVPFDANQTARDQGVGVYLDGVYLGRQQGLNAALFDVERIEVLRGPQGTLFGRNTEGGALSIISKAPTGKFGGRMSAGVGNYGSYNGEAHLDLPVFADLAFKLDGVIQHQGATTTNPLPGESGWNYYHRVGGRASARWTPVDGLTVDLSYDRAKDENTPFYSQLVNYNPQGRCIGPTSGALPICGDGRTAIRPLPALVEVSGGERMDTADIGVPQQPSVDQSDGFTGTIRYRLGSDLEFRSITAWRGVSTRQWDNSGGAHRTPFNANGLFSRYSLSDLDQTQFSQELQLIGSLPQIEYVLGAYYFNEHVEESAATPSSNRWNADGTGFTVQSPIVTGPVTSSNQGWADGSRFIQRASRAVAKSYALFGQATYTPAGLDAFHLTVGGRYTHDGRDGTLFTVQNAATDYDFHLSKSRFDPMVTAALEAARGINLYAKYSTGYRAGGANSRSQTFTAFGPESVKAYEIGAKMDLLDRRVRLNLAGYVMNRKGTQIDFDNVDTRQFLPDGVTPNPTFNLHTEETRNAPGVSKIRGAEAELIVKPTSTLTLGASYAYTHSVIPATANPLLPGNPLTQVFVVFTPVHAASAYADYELPIGLGGDAQVRFHIDGNYAGRQYSFQNEPTRTDASFIVNSSIAIADIPLNAVR